MKQIPYSGSFELSQLHDEIEQAAIAELAPVETDLGLVAMYTVSATSDGVIVGVPDDLAEKAEQQLAAIVAAHKPQPPPPPQPDAATTNLRAAVEAVTSAPDFETAKANLQRLIEAAQDPNPT